MMSVDHRRNRIEVDPGESTFLLHFGRVYTIEGITYDVYRGEEHLGKVTRIHDEVTFDMVMPVELE